MSAPAIKTSRPSPFAKRDRNRAIVRRVAGGESQAAVARELGISAERVRQIIQREVNGKGAS